jgi:hypothetical protein
VCEPDDPAATDYAYSDWGQRVVVTVGATGRWNLDRCTTSLVTPVRRLTWPGSGGKPSPANAVVCSVSKPATESETCRS